MGKILKWIGIVVGGLVGLIVLAIVVVLGISQFRLTRTFDVQPESITVPTDAAAVERGRHLAQAVAACVDCHGADLAGSPFIDDPAIGTIYTRNLTSGAGGAGGTFTDADWVRAIRHGVRPNGRGLLVMPSQDYYFMNDADLGALIAYLKSVPPVDSEIPDPQIAPMGRVLFVMGALPPLAAEIIDHTGPRPPAPAPGPTAEYGEYLASIACIGCHGPGLSGGPIAGAPPGFPPARNLTPSGNLANWTEAGFVTALRTGVTPEGYNLPGEFMPWPTFMKMTDDELKAIFAYLQSVPAKEAGTR